MGKKDTCAVFWCNNDRLFPEKYTEKDHISNTKLEKGDHYYIQTRHKDLFSHYNLIVRKEEDSMDHTFINNSRVVQESVFRWF